MTVQVFIIDDTESTRALIRTILRPTKFHVIGEATTLHSASEKVTAQSVDIVILDHELPDGDGIDFIPQLRELCPRAVIVVASSHNDPPTVRAALQSGAQGYVIKPFTAGALEDSLKGAWQRCSAPVGRTAGATAQGESAN